MAIVIPSKNIYDLSNPKVRDNVYNKVEVNAQKGVKDNKFGVTVADFSVPTSEHLEDLQGKDWTKSFDAKYTEYDYTGVEVAIAVAGARAVYINKEFVIKIEKDNSYISYLTALSQSSPDSYSITLQCNKYVGTGSIYTKALEYKYQNAPEYHPPENESPLVNITAKGIVVTAKEKIWADGRYAEATVDLPDNDDVKMSFLEKDGEIIVTVENILISYEAYSGTHYDDIKLITGWQNYYEAIVETNAEKYEPVSMNISFQGNTIGFDFKKETITIGENASKNALSIGENELIQSTNIYYPPFKHYYARSYEVIQLEKTYSQRVKVQFIHNGTKSEQYIAAGNQTTRIHNPSALPFEVVSVTFASNEISEFYKHILDEYNKGKETATLTCTMSQYLDANGEVVVDPAVYNVVDLNYFNGDGYSFNIDVDNGVIIMGSHGSLDGVQPMITYDGVPQAEQYVDGRIYYKNYFTNKTSVGLRFTLHATDRNEDDYGITFDTSYLPDGNYSLSYELDIKGDVVTILNLQINKGKARPYQKPVRMHFSEGDTVIPMKYTSSGTDVGISLYNNDINTPKQFKVTGVELFYDGVTRQKLTLQEV